MSRLSDLLAREISGYAPGSALGFAELGLDSFDLISLRVAVEQEIGNQIPDATWLGLRGPADLIAHAIRRETATQPAATAHNARRRYTIGMPQMAVGGLSESWLFKEIGDFHWQLVTDGLKTPSGLLADGNGDRLYATFTRFQIEHSHPLADYRENEALSIDASIARFGAGIFFGQYRGTAAGKTFSVRVMSSFTKRGETASNKELLKGQPAIPADCPIPQLTEKPAFSDEYRRLRHQTYDTAIFAREYRINPYTDINGVGLLYFAAYPTISDSCELDYIREGNGWAFRASTIARDICYFGNADIGDLLHYRVIGHQESDGSVEIDSLILRAGSHMPIAHLKTRKALR